MTSDEWDEIKRIFESAVKLPPAECDGYLDRACGDRVEMRRVVSDLVTNHDSQASLYQDQSSPRTCAFSDNQLVGGRFRIIHLLAWGGMGEVYEAFDERLRTTIALKTIRLELAQDQFAIERFRREIRISQEVAHPSICRVYDLIEHREADSVIPCLSMELLPGESLGQCLGKTRPLTAAIALPLIRQIVAALEVLHARDIVHRDLKPSNIMLVPGRNGALRAVVMDFGLARPVRNDSDIFETRTAVQAGAPYFMAPELFSDGRPSIASDIYALGLVMDEMMTSSRAFTADSLHSLLFQKLRERPVAPSLRNPDLPFGWEQAILKCIDPVAENRFPSVALVLEALENPLPSAIVTIPPVHRFTRRKLAFAAAAVPVVACAAIVVGLGSKPLSATMIVLPVANDSGLKEYEHICQTTQSELLRRFANVPGLRAVAWYGPVPENPRKLDARFLLESRMQTVGNGFQMILSLTDNVEGQVIWTHEFDPLQKTASLDLQTEAAQRVIEAVESYSTFGSDQKIASRVAPFVTPFRKLFGTEPAAMPGSTTNDRDAWDHFSRATELLDEDTDSSVKQGITLLKKAIDIDRNFARAYAALSRAYILAWGNGGQDVTRALSDAEEYAFKSLACDPRLPEAHVCLAAIHQNRWEWTDSKVYFTKALGLRPRFPLALRWFGGLLVQSGDFNQGLSYSSQAIEIDPYGATNYLSQGLFYYHARKFDQAIQTLKTRTSVYGSRRANQENLAIVYSWLGSVSKGGERAAKFQLALQKTADIESDERQEREESPSDLSEPLVSDQLKARIYALSGDADRARPYLNRLEASIEKGNTSPASVARCYSVLGEKKTALEHLEHAYVLKDPELMFIKVEPMFDSLRGESQFQQILRGMKLA